jgi:hypothetical protein
LLPVIVTFTSMSPYWYWMSLPTAERVVWALLAVLVLAVVPDELDDPPELLVPELALVLPPTLSVLAPELAEAPLVSAEACGTAAW